MPAPLSSSQAALRPTLAHNAASFCRRSHRRRLPATPCSLQSPRPSTPGRCRDATKVAPTFSLPPQPSLPTSAPRIMPSLLMPPPPPVSPNLNFPGASGGGATGCEPARRRLGLHNASAPSSTRRFRSSSVEHMVDVGRIGVSFVSSVACISPSAVSAHELPVEAEDMIHSSMAPDI